MEETWIEAYKIVPASPPQKDYPDYQVGYTYTHQGEVKLYESGFHASPAFMHCKKYIAPNKNCRYLKVRMNNPIWDSLNEKCVSSKLEVLSEYPYDEAQQLIQHVIINNSESHTKGFGYHREDKDASGNVLPAIILADGTMSWYKDGRKHREDKDANSNIFPAVILADGTKYWYKDGEIHREDKDADGNVLPAIIWADGRQDWYKDGKRHREDKDANGNVLPAKILADGTKYWYKGNKRHREDKDANGNVLPAAIYTDGRKEWYKDGVKQDKPNNVASPEASWTKERTQ